MVHLPNVRLLPDLSRPLSKIGFFKNKSIKQKPANRRSAMPHGATKSGRPSIRSLVLNMKTCFHNWKLASKTTKNTTIPSNTARGAFDKSAALGNVDWTAASSFKVKGSGHGGVVIVGFGDTKLVIKGGGGMSGQEVFGARLARHLGLSAPDTRLLSIEEQTVIQNQMAMSGVRMPERLGDSTATVVMQFVEGSQLDENRSKSKDEVTDLAKSLGEWVAFDAVISEQDRFHGFVSSSMPNGINTGNFLVNPTTPGEIIGIDQSVTAADTSKALTAIVEDDAFAFIGLGAELAKRSPGLGLDPEDLADIVKDSARTMLRRIGALLPDTTVTELAEGLEMNPGIVGSLTDRLSVAQKFAVSESA